MFQNIGSYHSLSLRCATTLTLFTVLSTDIGSIMRVEEKKPKESGSVSWTDKSVSYYLLEIDRSEVDAYKARLAQRSSA